MTRIPYAGTGPEPLVLERSKAFTTEHLIRMVAGSGLHIDESVIGAVVAAIVSGKHVILTGAPGTGKSTLAKLVSDLGSEARVCAGGLITTATSNWNVDQTLGYVHEGEAGPAFRPGIVLEAITSGRWLIIDELNRADVDRALGELFNVLSGHAVVLPFKTTAFGRHLSLVPPDADVPPDTDAIRVPKSWRIIATMNDHDRGQLYRLSHALMRRFAFVHVDSPDEMAFRTLLAGHGEIVAKLLPLRELRDIGPAPYIEASRFAALRLLDGAPPSVVLLEAFTGFFLPQFDELDDGQTGRLIGMLDAVLEPPERLRARTLIERAWMMMTGPER